MNKLLEKCELNTKYLGNKFGGWDENSITRIEARHMLLDQLTKAIPIIRAEEKQRTKNLLVMVRYELCFSGNWEDAKRNIDESLKDNK